MMRNIKLTIQYDGTAYSGWQSQKNSVAVQDVVEGALKKLLGESVKIVGAARTDAGVHAEGQVANFKTRSKLPLYNIKNGLNRKLPSDIVISDAKEADSNFHSQHYAKSKVYCYKLYTASPIPPFYRNFVARMPYKLNLNAMKREAKYLLGKHDFLSFQGSNSSRKSTMRNIYSVDIRRRGSFIDFYIEADGFLYNMARIIVGTLIDIGRGYLKAESIKSLLKKKDRRAAGPTVSAKGLCLIKVKY